MSWPILGKCSWSNMVYWCTSLRFPKFGQDSLWWNKIMCNQLKPDKRPDPAWEHTERSLWNFAFVMHLTWFPTRSLTKHGNIMISDNLFGRKLHMSVITLWIQSNFQASLHIQRLIQHKDVINYLCTTDYDPMRIT